MPLQEFIAHILWGLCLGSLVTFSILSYIIYKNNRERTFLYYSLYCFFMSIYIFFRMDMPNELVSLYKQFYTEAFNWFIQVVFYLLYISFALHFLDLHKTAVPIFNRVRKYQFIMLLVSLILYVACSVGLAKQSMYTLFFTFVFVPVHLMVSGYLIYHSLKQKSFVKHYFLAGSLIYMALAITAFVLSMTDTYPRGYDPIDFFFLAIICENTIFAYALGKKIQKEYRYRYHLQKQLNEAEKELQDQLKRELQIKDVENKFLTETNEKNALAAQIAGLQNQVLRNQMNSHFIFNVLNSIKAFILENERDKAVLYLNKFSKFIRKILDGSIYNHSNLQEEIETAQLYISIENMRFNNEIRVTLETDPAVNMESIKFPPLLLQPFIENAIWHGLGKIKEEKHLKIAVRGEGDKVTLDICDNGVGYLTNSGRPEGHQSNGIKILDQRINEFNAQNNFSIQYFIRDESECGNGRGTCVHLVIYVPANEDSRVFKARSLH